MSCARIGIFRSSITGTMAQVMSSYSDKNYDRDFSRTIADVGKVLAGVQVPPEDRDAFEMFLERLGYQYIEETDNEVYRQYLRR